MSVFKSLTVVVVLVLGPLGGCQGSPPAVARQWSDYGEMPVGSMVRVSPGSLKGDEHDVAVRGVIDEVCLNKGCWLRISDPHDPAVPAMLVKPRDYAFFLPRNCGGRNVIVYGEAVRKTLSVADLQHFAHDAHKSEAEITLITEPKTEVVFIADSILIEGAGLEPPIQ